MESCWPRGAGDGGRARVCGVRVTSAGMARGGARGRRRRPPRAGAGRAGSVRAAPRAAIRKGRTTGAPASNAANGRREATRDSWRSWVDNRDARRDVMRVPHVRGGTPSLPHRRRDADPQERRDHTRYHRIRHASTPHDRRRSTPSERRRCFIETGQSEGVAEFTKNSGVSVVPHTHNGPNSMPVSRARDGASTAATGRRSRRRPRPPGPACSPRYE